MDANSKTRVIQNTLFILIAQITNIFLQMVYLVVAARYLGNVQFGKLSFAMAFTQMFLAVTDLGLFNYAVREISRKKVEAHRYFINLFVLKLLLGICVLTIIAFIISILNYPSDTIITTYLLSLGLCLFSLNTTFIPKLIIDIPFCKEMLFYSLPIGIGAVCWSFYNRVDVSLLSFMKGDVSVGEYTAAYRLTNTLAFIPSAYMSAIFPIMAKQYIDVPTPLLNTLCQKSCKLMFIIAFPIALILTLRAPTIIDLLYGKAYCNAVISLRILSWTILFTFISNIFSYLLISTFKTSKEFTLYALLGLVLNVGCNCLLIPILDLNGAAISTVITEVFILMLYYRSVTKEGFYIPLLQLAIKPFLASLPIVCIVYFLDIKNIFVAVSVSIIIYLSILIVIKGIQRDEIKEVWGILKNFHAYRH